MRASPVKAVTVVRTLARREEGFPRESRRIVNPRFLGFGVAAGRLPLLKNIAASPMQTCVYVLQFFGAFDLNAQMVKARL